jgi:glyoxylase-like metal-dependent hydrolase (beta-lactamase superfamily II)
VPDTAASIRAGGLDPVRDIDTVILSHSHWDHVGTPTDYPSSRFVVSSGTLSIFETGMNHYPASMFDKDPLPLGQTYELPPVSGSKEAHTAAQQQTQHQWSAVANFPHAVDYFGDGSIYIIDSPGHLRGHINLLLRGSPDKRIYLGADCCHDPRILTGEKNIAMYDDGHGGQRSVHSDLPKAMETIDRIQVLLKNHPNVEWIVAHDLKWANANQQRFFPGKL